MNLVKSQSGQSVLEIIIAVAIFGLVAGTLISYVMGGDQALNQGGEQTKAAALAQEGMEAARSIRDYAWNNLVYNQSGVSTSSNGWVFDGEGTSDSTNEFTRTITFANICRSNTVGLHQIVACPGDYTDVESKLVTVTVSWPVRPGVNDSVQRISYLTNWKSVDWTQSDWSGGSGQSIWSVANKFDSSDGNINFSGTPGQISLNAISGATVGATTWNFGTSTDYSYDPTQIEVLNSFAQLKATTSNLTGSTTNSSFDSNSTGWTFQTWEASSTTPTSGRTGSGGNPNGYLYINFAGAKNSTSSGYWYQPFTVTATNLASATAKLDWSIINFSSVALQSFVLYLFVDTTPANPVLGAQVWTSPNATSTTSWYNVSNIDIRV